MIKSSFSIKDLENLSNVKAHTIRIWEKRYALLEPERSNTNIRTYNVSSLQKILNISLLNENGVKISKIADMSVEKMELAVKELVIRNNKHHSLNAFKMSMMTFDAELFNLTYNQLLAQNSFREIFLSIFVEILEEIGFLWQTKTILPAHEHFISTLIKQKILINVERIQNGQHHKGKTYILFLPINEIHEIGLLYLHFELLLKGHHSVYLGASVPIENLAETQKIFGQTEFVSYFTVSPTCEDVPSYLKEIDEQILSLRDEKLHLFGRNTQNIKATNRILQHKTLLEGIEQI